MAYSRGQKFLFGCLGCFGGIVVLVVVVLSLFVHWVKTPGIPLEGSRLYDAATAVYAEVHLRSEDPGAREFVRVFLNAARNPPIPDNAKVPVPMTMILGNLPRREATDAELDKILPLVLVMRRQAGPGGEAAAPMLGLSLSPAGNSLRILHAMFNFIAWRGKKIEKEVRGDQDIFRVNAESRGQEVPVWVSFVGTDALLARDGDAVRAGVDTLAAAPAGAPSPLAALRPEQACIFLVAKPGYAGAALDTIAELLPGVADTLRPVVKGGSGLTVWGTLKSADILEGEVHLTGAAPGTVPAAADLSGKATLMIGPTPLDVSFEPLVAGAAPSPGWKLRVAGLEAAARARLLHVDR
ncbi:MAG TPA: hypothetical protein VE404_04660 [Verrucomicrobiae bacterium]|nr:hypothetical protein [Verrucomicrobiae bacterium]